MEKKKLTYEDFPIKVTDAVQAAFENDVVVKRSAEALVQAIMHETQMQFKNCNPWKIVQQEMPELAQYMADHRHPKCSYDHLTKKIDVVNVEAL